MILGSTFSVTQWTLVTFVTPQTWVPTSVFVGTSR